MSTGAVPFLSNIDLTLNQLLNTKLEILGSDPTAVAGRVIYNSTAQKLKFSTASTWIGLYADTTPLNSITAPTGNVSLNTFKLTNVVDPSSAQDAATKNYVDTRTINTLAAQTANYSANTFKITNVVDPSAAQDAATKNYVDTRRLDQFAAPTASVSFNSQLITNVATPVSGTDATNKNYVDNLVNGLAWKDNVRAATTVNVTLSGTQTIDGVALIAGDRVLVKNQTTASQNGIYVVAAGAWARSVDADSATEIQSAATLVDEGSTYANTSWTQTADGVTLGSTSITFVQFGNSGSAPLGGDGITLNGGQYDVNVDNSSIEINSDILRVKAGGITNAMLASGIDAAKITTGVLALAQGGLAIALTSSGNRTTARGYLVESGEFLVKGKAIDITGDGTTTAFDATHNFGTKDVTFKVKEATTDQFVEVDVVATTTNKVTVNFAVAPVNAKVYRVIVMAAVA